MTALASYDRFSRNFYGIAIDPQRFPSFAVEIRHGVTQGIDYAYVVFVKRSEQRIAWRIRPTAFDEAGNPTELSLLRTEGHRFLNRRTTATTHRYERREASAETVEYMLSRIAEFEADRARWASIPSPLQS